MESIRIQVARARRRMLISTFSAALAWSLFIALTLAAGVIAADWFWDWPLTAVWILSVAGGLSLAAALAWTWRFAAGSLDAAIELDRRFGLRERVSSALSLSSSDLDSEAGRAVTDDAEHRVRGLQVSRQFPIRISPWSLLPLLPAIGAVLLIYLLPPLTTAEAANSQDQKQRLAAVESTMQRLNDQLQQRREQAKEQGLQDLDEMLKQLQDGTKQVVDKKTADPSQAVVKLNDLSKEFEKRRDELNSAEKLRDQLSQLKGANEGPADKLAKSLKNGDLKQAVEELDKLKKQLQGGDLDDKQVQQLADQLNEMQQKLLQAVKDHEQKKQALQDQIDQAKAAGNQQQADQLQQQLDKHNQQGGQMQQLQKMADQLGQCGKCMNEGNVGDALAGLDGLKQDLNDLQQQLDEMKLIDGAIDQLSQAKSDMLCQGECQNPGNQGQGAGRSGQSDQWIDGRGGGNGIGRGSGGSFQGQDPGEHKFIDSAVSGRNQGGSGMIVGEADGPNRRGQIREQIKSELAPAQAERSDPIDNQQYPKPYREHTQQYLDALREGRPAGNTP